MTPTSMTSFVLPLWVEKAIIVEEEEEQQQNSEYVSKINSRLP